MSRSQSRHVRLVVALSIALSWTGVIASEQAVDEDGRRIAWPDDADGELPFGGIFYGSDALGIATANAEIAVQSSRRFRAERDGAVASVRYHNRVLLDRDISSRCSKRGMGPWCDCQEAELDAYSCGYTLGSSYSVGNGGLISIELRRDAGDGLPREEALGRTRSFVPLDLADERYPSFQFVEPPTLVAGELYHLVYVNDNPPLGCALRAESIGQARYCPRDAGAIGLNGLRVVGDRVDPLRYGPQRGLQGAANLVRRSTTGEWIVDPWVLSFFELGYVDGVSVGDSYHALDATRDALKAIEGKRLARQTFVVEGPSRLVDGVWINFGHTQGADGDALDVRLKRGDETLAEGVLGASPRCRELVLDGDDRSSRHCRAWGHVEFETPILLTEGERHALVLEGPDAAGFTLSAYQTLSGFGFEDRDQWDGATAEISEDGGASWVEWTEHQPRERDLPVLFTVLGMPRSMP